MEENTNPIGAAASAVNPLAAGLGSIGGSLVGGIFGLIQQHIENKQQKELLQQEQQFSHDEAQIAREFNDAPAQFQRMVEAGFNPHLAAQSVMGSQSGAPAANAFSPSAPSVPSAIGTAANLFGGAVGNAMQNIKMLSDMKVNDSVANKNNVEAGEYVANSEAQRNYLNAHAEELFSLKDKNDAERKKIEEELKYIGPLSQAQYDYLSSATINNVAAAANQLAQAQTEENKRKALDAAAAKDYSVAEEAHAQAELSGSVKESVDLENKQKKFAMDYGDFLAGVPISLEHKQQLHDGMKMMIAQGASPEKAQEFVLNEVSPYLDAGLALGRHVQMEQKNIDTDVRMNKFGVNSLLDLAQGVLNMPSTFANGLGSGAGLTFGYKGVSNMLTPKKSIGFRK